MDPLPALITTVVAAVFISSTGSTPGKTIQSQATDNHVDVWIHDQIHKGQPVNRRNAKPTTLTSYQRVCTATTTNNYTAADTCHRSTTLCPTTTPTTTSTPVWVMTAPATPTPRPDDWTNTGRITCRTTTQPARTPTITTADFRRLPIPPATITIQPDPDTNPTLINIPTNLYVDPTPTTLPTTVLGQPVRVRATPATYTWRYGDHTRRTTTDPGGPYPNLSTGHTYTRPGKYTSTLTTTYTGQYAVTGGPWQPIDGTATVTSPTTRITALEARNQLTR